MAPKPVARGIWRGWLVIVTVLICLPTGVVQASLRLSGPSVPLYFEANQGQAPEEVDFLSRGNGYTIVLKNTEALITLQHPQEGTSVTDDSTPPQAGDATRRSIVRMQLVGANEHAQASGQQPLGGKVNYLLGNDSAKWRTDIPAYTRVQYGEIYPGIDLVYYGNQGQLEYDFIVQPGADPSVIQLTFTGATPRLDETGDLFLNTTDGDLRLRKPYIYQEIEGQRQPIDGGYVLSPLPGGKAHPEPSRRSQGEGAHSLTFQLATYDPTKPLILDPILTYSSYLGGNGLDNGVAVTTDAAGNVYITGDTASNDFLADVAEPSFDTFGGGSRDAFVVKLDSDGRLVYVTYLGGSARDVGHGIAVDSLDRAYVTGETNSTNFPTQGANADTICGVDNSCPGDNDAFVTWLNPSGSALIFSTFLGGGNDDRSNAIAVDMGGNVYVTGFTESSNFPGQNCFGEESGAPGGFGNRNAFVLKYDSTTSPIYSCFLGGSGSDEGLSIAVDTAGSAYVTGRTRSDDFPTQEPFQPMFGGGEGDGDGFVTKLNASGSALVYSTYLGGNEDERGADIAVDAAGSAYVTGTTFTDNFPTTADAIQPALRGFRDGFVTKLNASGSALVYSTYLGGDANDIGRGISVDAAGNAYVIGYTRSDDFPTMNAIQPMSGGGDNEEDGFVTKLNASGSALVYSTYLGGNEDERGADIAVDADGNVYVTGRTRSADFPLVDALQSDLSGFSDAFIVKITESIRAAFESPIVGAVAGVALVRGWAFNIFEGESISAVEFFINGILNTTIPCCSERQDIRDDFPDFPLTNTLNSGWGLTLNWGNLEAGSNEVSVRITSTSGDVWQSETREVFVVKPADSVFLSNLDLSTASASLSGEALVLSDVVVTDSFTQLPSTVDVRYRFDESSQGLALVESMTVAQVHSLKRWFASVEQNLNQWWQGTSLVSAAFANPDLQTEFEAPGVGPVQGVSLVRGWAFDTLPGETIDLVELFIDGVRNTKIPCCSVRQDVTNANPGFPAANTLNSGWGLTLNWGNLSAGAHNTQVRFTSSTGEVAMSDTRMVTVVKLGNFAFIDDFDVSAASVSIDGQDIVLTGVIVQDKATQQLANITLRLRWTPATQGLAIISAAPVS